MSALRKKCEGAGPLVPTTSPDDMCLQSVCHLHMCNLLIVILIDIASEKVRNPSVVL